MDSESLGLGGRLQGGVVTYHVPKASTGKLIRDAARRVRLRAQFEGVDHDLGEFDVEPLYPEGSYGYVIQTHAAKCRALADRVPIWHVDHWTLRRKADAWERRMMDRAVELNIDPAKNIGWRP